MDQATTNEVAFLVCAQVLQERQFTRRGYLDGSRQRSPPSAMALFRESCSNVTQK